MIFSYLYILFSQPNNIFTYIKMLTAICVFLNEFN